MGNFSHRHIRYVNLVLILGATLFSISSACKTCNSPWKKIYENDDHGRPMMGDKMDVVVAAERGARLKVLMHDLNGITHSEEFVSYYSFGHDMCGDSPMHVTKDRWNHFLNGGLRWVQTVCSFALGGHIEVTFGEYNVTNKKHYRAHISWFSKDSACPEPVYTHFLNGTASNGNKDELKFAVLSGYDIKYIMSINNKKLTYFSSNTAVVDDSEEVVGQTAWSVVPVMFYFNPIWWYTMVSTTGSDYIRWYMGKDVWRNHEGFDTDKPVEWYVEPCWRHSFTHDENGVEQDGSLVDLIAAVEQGRRVKVVMGAYSTEVDNIRTEGGQVSAQLLSQLSKKDSYTFSDDMFYIWQMVHTSGTVRTKKYNIGNGTNRGDTVEKKTISWYVDTSPWTKILSTEKYGQVTSGSKADLKNAIENGASVRIGLQNSHGSGWFVVNAESIEFGPSGEFAAELFRIVSTEAVSPTEFQIKDDPFWKFMLVTTESNVDILQWRVGARINDGHFSEKATVNWFVNY